MRTAPAIGTNSPNEIAAILSLGMTPEDQASLRAILRPDLNSGWTLRDHSSVFSVRAALRQAEEVAIILVDQECGPCLWKELLVETRAAVRPPFLIVTSRLADERLWAEALNLGAYDVLTRPFEKAEAARVIHLALLRWQRTRVSSAKRRAAVA
jgi:DNA-binding response OmpR family regulator